MPRFAYKAVKPSGEVIEGVMDAVDRTTVVERLRGQGNIPIRATEWGRAGARRSLRLLGLRARGPGMRDIITLTQELASLLRAGVPLDRALTILADLQQAGQIHTIVTRVQELIHGGSTFADALETCDDAFPNFYIGMVRAGEAGGSLEKVLARLAETLERSQDVKDEVKSALRYPMVVLFVAAAAIIILMTAVIPEFQPLFEDAGAALPFSTQVIIAVSEFVRAFWWVLAGGVLVAYVALQRTIRKTEGRAWWDGLLLKAPLVGNLISKVETARFARTLGALLSNGVNITTALIMTAGTLGNSVVVAAVIQAEERVKKGERLAEPLIASGVFPRLAVQLIQVGEESGELESMLLRVAEMFDAEVSRTIQRILALLVPIITIGLGIVVAGIIGSILAAILSAYDLPF